MRRVSCSGQQVQRNDSQFNTRELSLKSVGDNAARRSQDAFPGRKHDNL